MAEPQFQFKFGRKPARQTLSGLRSAVLLSRVLEPLGDPPEASYDYMSAVQVPWQIFGNDRYGNCVEVDTAHALMLRTANASTKIVIPTEEDVLQLYTVLTGFDRNNPDTDQGTDEMQMIEYLQDVGFLGHKASAVGTLDPKNLNYIRWCIQLFGHCRLGLMMPGYSMQQFNSYRPWDVSFFGDQKIVGGHDVPLVDYRNGLFTCITWGRPQAITPAFILKYNEEAHVELFFDWIKEQGHSPSGFNLQDLTEELKQIGRIHVD